MSSCCIVQTATDGMGTMAVLRGDAESRNRAFRMRAFVPIFALAVLSSGCSFIATSERSATISDDSDPTTDTSAPDITTGDSSDENSDGADIAADGQPDGLDESEESLDPVTDRAEVSQLRAAIRDILGPTTDVSAQVNRLVPYPDIPTPAGAHLRDLGSDLRSNDDDTLMVDTDADFYADGSVDDLVVFYQTQLPPLDWNLVNTSTDTDFRDNPITVMDFEMAGDDEFRPTTLTVTLVESVTLTKILVMTNYRANDADRSHLDTFAGWYDLDLLPENGELVDASVSTRAQDITTAIALRSHFDYPDREGEEIIAELGERATELSLEIEERTEDRWTVSATPNYPRFDYYNFNIDEPFSDDPYQVTVSGGFAFLPTYLDPAALPDDPRVEPLADSANIYEIEAIMRQMSGRTDDVSEQMNRIAPFPEVPTPDGTTIVASGFNLREGSLDETTQRFTYVNLLVKGTVEDLLVFHETQFAALGWTESARNAGEPDDGVTKTTIEFTLPAGVQDGSDPTFTVNLWDDDGASYVEVQWEYGERVSAELNSMERWLGWQGQLPFRSGRVPESLQIDDNSLSDFGLQVTATYRFESPAEVVMPQVERRLSSSDYSLAPEPALTTTSLDLVHPDFESVSMLFNNGIGDDSSVLIIASRPYLAEGVELIFD